MNILMIEDDVEMAEVLTGFLKTYNIYVTNYTSPIMGLNALKSNIYDLIILDLSLPDIDGIEVCNLIRQKSCLPIIISSARVNIADKVACFTYGVDDFLPKPYDSQELILRIKSVLRRFNLSVQKENEMEKKSVFIVDENRMQIKKDDASINLTNAEYYILEYMINKAGFVITREEMLSNVTSIKYESTYKSIDVLIGRVRNKIEHDTKKPKFILSVRGVGYKFINE